MQRIEFKKYAGFKVKGGELISKSHRSLHINKASWLTAMVESGGRFGAVMNYDGTGMTAGIHQAIAVYPGELRHPDGNPRDDQGPLWKLLNMLRDGTREASIFWDDLEAVGWHLGLDNVLRWRVDGSIVRGLDIRREFNGSVNGIVPVRGEGRLRAERWMESFSRLFSNEGTFEIQEEYGIKHFAKRASRAKFRFSKNKEWQKQTMNDVMYEDATIDLATFEDDPELDLALCMYWSHSVNAPGMALKVLCRELPTIFRVKTTETWARSLIRRLGNCSYGRWDDDLKNGRYQRTRKHAMDSKFWPDRLFKGPKAIMPRNLAG